MMRVPGLRRPGRRQPRRGLPGELATVLGIEPGVRVLAWSPLAGGGGAAATIEGLRALTPFGRQVRRPWTDVDRVAWEGQSRTLAVWWVGSRQPLPLELVDTARLPEVVHERVQSSVVLSQRIEFGSGRSVRVAVRKAADGSLFVQEVASPGVRLDDPEIAERIRAVSQGLRDDAGIG